MNFDALDEIIKKNTDLRICTICGTPFRPYHSRQKTCGSEECKRLYRNRRSDDRRRRKLAETPDEFRAYRRDAERKYRKKKRNKEVANKNYAKIQAYWQRQAELREYKLDGGLDYGKRQMEKTLAQVPKIDVSGFEKENKK